MHFDNGNLIAEIGPLGRSTQYAFDAQNHLALVIAPATTDHATGKTHYAYDLRGDLVSVTDPWGRTWWCVYDELDVSSKFNTTLSVFHQGQPRLGPQLETFENQRRLLRRGALFVGMNFPCRKVSNCKYSATDMSRKSWLPQRSAEALGAEVSDSSTSAKKRSADSLEERSCWWSSTEVSNA